jgi:hypothetical protein
MKERKAASERIQIVYDTLQYKGRIFHFRKPFEIYIKHKSLFICIWIPQLGLNECGCENENVKDTMSRLINFIWESYASKEDRRLTIKTRRLKKRFKELIKVKEPFHLTVREDRHRTEDQTVGKDWCQSSQNYSPSVLYIIQVRYPSLV